MAVVKTPVEGFTGTVVGVTFTDGVGETDDLAALAYFERQGYEVEIPDAIAEVVEIPDGEPTDKWTKPQIVAFLLSKDVEASEDEKKDDLLAKVPPVE